MVLVSLSAKIHTPCLSASLGEETSICEVNECLSLEQGVKMEYCTTHGVLGLQVCIRIQQLRVIIATQHLELTES